MLKTSIYAATALSLSLLFSGCANTDSNTANNDQSNTISNMPITYERVEHIIQFDFDSAKVNNRAYEIMRPHADYLIANPWNKVSIQGNASEEGEGAYNHDLALQRALAIKEILLEFGVDGSQLLVRSVGEIRSHMSPARSVTLAY